MITKNWKALGTFHKSCGIFNPLESKALNDKIKLDDSLMSLTRRRVHRFKKLLFIGPRSLQRDRSYFLLAK